jgi:hypothetical protein
MGAAESSTGIPLSHPLWAMAPAARAAEELEQATAAGAAEGAAGAAGLLSAIAAARVLGPLGAAAETSGEGRLATALAEAEAALWKAVRGALEAELERAPVDAAALHVAVELAERTERALTAGEGEGLAVAGVEPPSGSTYSPPAADEPASTVRALLERARVALARVALGRLTAAVEKRCLLAAIIHVEGGHLSVRRGDSEAYEKADEVRERIKALEVKRVELDAKQAGLRAALGDGPAPGGSPTAPGAPTAEVAEKMGFGEDVAACQDAMALGFPSKAHYDHCKALGLLSKAQYDLTRKKELSDSARLQGAREARSKGLLKRQIASVLSGAGRGRAVAEVAPWTAGAKRGRHNGLGDQGGPPPRERANYIPAQVGEARALLKELVVEAVVEALTRGIKSGDPVHIQKGVLQAEAFLRCATKDPLWRSFPGIKNCEQLLATARTSLAEAAHTALTRATRETPGDSDALLAALSLAEWAGLEGGGALVATAKELVAKNAAAQEWEAKLTLLGLPQVDFQGHSAKWKKEYIKLVDKGLLPEETPAQFWDMAIAGWGWGWDWGGGGGGADEGDEKL